MAKLVEQGIPVLEIVGLIPARYMYTFSHEKQITEIFRYKTI